jgi:hypothetical protein
VYGELSGGLRPRRLLSIFVSQVRHENVHANRPALDPEERTQRIGYRPRPSVALRKRRMETMSWKRAYPRHRLSKTGGPSQLRVEKATDSLSVRHFRHRPRHRFPLLAQLVFVSLILTLNDHLRSATLRTRRKQLAVRVPVGGL